MSQIRVSIVFALLVLCGAQSASGYAVITHEAIVDSAWKDITPILLQRFPATTPEDLKKAHAYAYGGCIIQDMGYSPFGSKYFSDLVHYVRSGDFVEALLNDAQDAGHSSSSCVQQASRRKTGLRASPARPAQGADTNSAVSRRARPKKVGSW